MNREDEVRCKQLALKIKEVFQKGINISDNVRHYIDSTFSCFDSESLEKILNDETDMEIEPLMELLFFPDESMQVQVESILESYEFKNEDNEKVTKYLLKNISDVRLQDNDGCIDFSLPVPQWAAVQFISRLNICRQANPLILQAVNTHVKSSVRDLVKVKLRNSRFIDTDNKIYFLCNFFKSIDVSDYDLLQLLDFILIFLDETSEDITIFKALIQRKKSLFRNLQQALKFEEQLKSTNMEILLLQGVRAPHINPDETRKKMAFIDKICVAVFGRTEHIEEIHAVEYHDDNPDAQNIIKAFLP